jgi:hypothetical protein
MPNVGPVILITSCESYRHNGFNDAIRSTWLSAWGALVAHKFVLGRESSSPNEDEIVLDADDSYKGTPHKHIAARRWATENGFEHSFHCDADTYVIVPRLLVSGFDSHEHVGYFIWDEHRLCKEYNIEFAQGGAGYSLGPQAASVVENSKVIWPASDVHVGDVLKKAGVPFTHDVRYWASGFRRRHEPTHLEGGNVYPKDMITAHLSNWWEKPKYRLEWMTETHQRFMAGEL